MLPGFGAPSCYPSALIDLANNALASNDSVETVFMTCQGYRTHRNVTGPMNFKKSGFFLGKLYSRIFGAPGCHPGTLIDIVNTGLDSKDSAETICMISEG